METAKNPQWKQLLLASREGFIPYIHYSIEDVDEYVEECMRIMNVSEEELEKQ